MELMDTHPIIMLQLSHTVANIAALGSILQFNYARILVCIQYKLISLTDLQIRFPNFHKFSKTLFLIICED